jgi:tRNA dimethylallyltransferase
MHKPTVIFLLGPTAAGKTEFALKLAKGIDAEIISCDSMQVYKRMDIISSKPSPSQRREVKHHLIDIIPPNKTYNASLYRRSALKAIKLILRKKKTPLFVGGTGLYASAVLHGIFKGPGENRRIRKKLYQQAEKRGTRYIYQRLFKVDPLAAARIHPHDLKRIIRALEVWEETGKPISQWQQQRRGIGSDYHVEIFCITRSRQELYGRINQRVEQMFKKGLVQEVAHLLKGRLSKTASCAIGIREIKNYLAGRCSLNQAKDLIKRHTRQYAKRQLTWFRKDKRISWINITDKKPGFSLT